MVWGKNIYRLMLVVNSLVGWLEFWIEKGWKIKIRSFGGKVVDGYMGKNNKCKEFCIVCLYSLDSIC